MHSVRALWEASRLPLRELRAKEGTAGGWTLAQGMMDLPRFWEAAELIAVHLLHGGELRGPRWHALAYEAATVMHGRWRCWNFATWPGAKTAGIPRTWHPPARPGASAPTLEDRALALLARCAGGVEVVGIGFGIVSAIGAVLMIGAIARSFLR